MSKRSKASSETILSVSGAIVENALVSKLSLFVTFCQVRQSVLTAILYPRRLEDVDDKGHDEDDEAIDDRYQHALVSAH